MTAKIKTIIIEDEAPARKLLQNYLEGFDEVEVIDECTDGFQGAKKIMELKPDLIFLDIQMPRISGFEMLELIDNELLPVIIFTTAYDEFAIKAFEYNTCDYLLKPLSKDRFDKALQKAIVQVKKQPENRKEQLLQLVDSGINGENYLQRIVIRSGSQLHVVQCDDLICIEANDDYVIVHTSTDQLLKKQTLKFYEKHLDPKEFLRVHRSFIVKISSISRLEPYTKDAFVAILKNGFKVSVSKSGYSKLKDSLHF